MTQDALIQSFGSKVLSGTTLLVNTITIPLVVYAVYRVFFLTPLERQMGIIQKIFYFHLPLAFGCFLFFAVVAVASVWYLFSGSRTADTVANAAAEVGVLACLLVCLTGALWARGTWGVYWTADPRLTTVLILLFIYVGYLILRASAADAPGMRTMAAVTGVVGFAAVPLVYFSVHIWATIHPVVIEPDKVALAPEIQATLAVCMPIGLLLLTALFFNRLQVGLAEDQLNTAKQLIADREDDALFAAQSA